MSNWSEGFFATLAAIVGLAIIAVIVSRNANTPAVISSIGTAFGGAIQAAVSPLGTGGGTGGFGASYP
jgi:hypothetical protein